jgi:hypothetical protein
MTLQTFEGGCHCGRVRFRVTADLSRVTDCNCSMCSKKGFLHLIVPPERFELVSGARRVDHLPLQHRLAKHTFCSTCRDVPRSDPDKIINVRCLDGVLSALKVLPLNWEHSMTERVRGDKMGPVGVCAAKC